jgi:hypothetical protein
MLIKRQENDFEFKSATPFQFGTETWLRRFENLAR